MGSLRTLTILLALGAWGAATEGAPPGDGTSPTSGTTRANLPAPPVEYLKGGIGLFQKGDQANAAKYLKVANDYRDQLQPGERAQLDDYLAKLSPAPVDPAVKPTSMPSASSDPAPTTAPMGKPRSTTDVKQDARWKLQAAHEQIRMGNYDEATRIVVEVQKMDVKWGLFDETPTKVAEAIAKARPKTTGVAAGAHDKKQAIARLKEARDLLDHNQFEQAEAIAIEVNSWGLSYGLMEEKPAKVAAAARALRKRDQARNTPAKFQPSPAVYDVAVSEARHLLAVGQYDQAEFKARQALKMNVYPTSTADRAEAVLNDIAAAKANAGLPATPTTLASATPIPATASATKPAAPDTESIIAERNANELLAAGKTDAAATKYLEADRLKAQEMAQAPALDQAVRRVNAAAPALAAPADNAAPPLVGLADPTSPPAAMPPPEASPLQIPGGLPALSSDAPPAGNKGEELLSQSKSLFASGNYAAAREKASEAKSGQYGVEPQADEMLAQIALSEQGGALAVYEAALDSLRGKNGTPPDFEKARALLNEVLASGSGLDEGMTQKVQDLLLKLPKDGSGKATASDVPTSDAESLKAQQLNAEVGTKVAEARRLMETDPDKAIALLQTTLASVKAAEMPAAVARTMTRRLEVAIELSKKDKVGFDAKMLDKGAKADIELKKLRILEADKAKKAAIKDLMTKAEAAEANGDWAKAEELARRASEIDPEEIAAVMLTFKARTQRHYEVDQKNRKEKEEGFLSELQDTDAAGNININASRNGIDYPKNFKEIAERRRKMQMSDVRPKSVSEMAIEKKLNEPITINFNDQTLGEAITFIQNYTGLNVILDPKALNDEGLSRDSSKVTLQANSIKLKTALKFMLRPLGLTYKAEDDVLLITSPLASKDSTYKWVYPVADLVVMPVKPKSPLQQGGLVGNDNGTAAMANSMSNTDPLVPSVALSEQTVTVRDMMSLIQLITTTIAPNTWRINDPSGNENGAYGMGGAFGGGGADAEAAQPGSITPFLLSISLIIRHTAEVHEEVAELLKQLRRLQDLQVSIEVRFVTVSDDFFEQIGVDFDFNIQSKAVGKGTTFAAPNPAVALFPFNSSVSTTTSGSTSGSTSGTTSGSTSGSTSGGTSGTTGGTSGGTTGGGGGGFAGGGGTTGGGGGAGGISGGGFAGGGGGQGGAGSFGGGTSGGGASGTTGSGSTTSSGGTTPTYLVNPFLDSSLGRKTPIVVGTSAGGLNNFTGNLGIPLTQGSASQIAPFNAVPGAGATLGISFLSDLEMFLFLTAAQGDARNNIVQAPKITTFNGSLATISNNQQQNYIQTLTPVVAGAAVAFQPTVGTLPDGVTLSVTPVVSSDRRYVRLSLAPFFQTVNSLTSLTFPAAAVGGGGLGGQATALNTTIQLPQTTTTTLTTTVTVPDGGTVLLGGVKRMREQRLEYGVPVLAKTPLINRLFRNIGIGRRTDSLMLMVTPKIIILEEEEDRLGVRTVSPSP